MATNEERLERYAEWIVANKDKQGSQEFATVSAAYRELRQQPLGIAPTPIAPTEEDTSLFGYIPETAKALAAGTTGLLESAATGAAFLLPEKQEQAARKKIAEVGGRVQEALAPDQAYEGWYLDLMRGVGSTLPFFAAAATAPISAPLALISGTAMGVGAGAGEAAQRAEAAGATEEEISKAAGLGMLPGALEMVGPAGVIRRARRVLGRNTDEVVEALDNTLRSRLKRVYDSKGGRIGRAALDEAVQEAVSEVGQNLIQRGIYDPERGVFTDTGESAALGGGVGGLLATLTEIVMPGVQRFRSRGVTPEAAPEAAPEPTPTATTPPPAGDLFGREEAPTELSLDDIEGLGIDLDRPTAESLYGLDLANPEEQAKAWRILALYRNRIDERGSDPETVSRIDSLLRSEIFRGAAPAEVTEPTVAPEQITLEEQAKAAEETTRQREDEQQRQAEAIQQAELTAVQERIESTRQRESEQKRREVLLPIIERGEITNAENMARAFSAELGRQGFTNTTPTQSELALIDRALGVEEAITAKEQEQKATATAAETEQRAGAAAIEQFVPERTEPTAPVEPVEPEPPAGLTNRERLDRTGRIPLSGEAQLEIPTIERPEQAIRRLDIPEGAVVSPLPEVEETQVPEEQISAIEPENGIPKEGVEATRRRQPQQNLTDLNVLQNVTIPKDPPKGTSVGYAMAHYVQNTTDFDQALRSIAFELVAPEKAKSLSINYKNEQRRANKAKQWVKNNTTPETFKLLEDYTAQERLKEKQRVEKDTTRTKEETQATDYGKTEIESVTDADYTDFLSEEVVNEFTDIDEFLTKNAVAASMGTVSAEVENALFDNKIDSALRQLANSTPNPDVKRTANKLAAAIKDLGITIEFVDGGIVNQKGDIAVAAYNPNTKTISFDIDSDTSVHAVLHESAHAVLHEIIKNKNHPVTKALTKLFNNVANRLPTAYGTQSLADFVTEAFVNPEFQALLAAYKITGEKTTAWRKFVNAVARFLGLSTKPITVADAASAYVDMILGTEIDTRTATQINQAIAEGNTDQALNLMLGGRRFVSNKTLDETRTGFLANVNNFTTKQSVNFLNGMGLQAIVDLAKKGPKEYADSIDNVQEIFYQIDGIRNEEMKRFTGIVNDAKKAFKLGPFREDSKNIAIANELVGNMTLEGIDAFIPEAEEKYSKNALTYGVRIADGKFEQKTEYFDTVKELDAKETELRNERKEAIRKKEQARTFGKITRQETSAERVEKYKELREKMKQLTPSQRGAIKKIRDEYSRLDEKIRAAEDANIEKIKIANDKESEVRIKNGVREILFRKRLEFGRIDPYFKLYREGEYWLEFEYIDGKGQVTYGTGSYETTGDREVAIKRLQAQPAVERGSGQPGIIAGTINRRKTEDIRNRISQGNIPSIEFITELQTRINNVFKSIPELEGDAKEQVAKSKVQVTEFLQDLVLRSLPEKGIIESKQAREGIHFFEGDFIHAFEQTMPRFITSYANIEHKVDLAEAAQEVRIARDALPQDQPFLKELATVIAGTTADTDAQPGKLPSYVEFAKNPYLPSWARTARALTFNMTLGANVSSVAVNVSIMPIVLQSRLAGEYGPLKATAATMEAMGLYLKTFGKVARDGVLDVDENGNPLSEDSVIRELGGFSVTNELGQEMAAFQKYAAPIIQRLKTLGMDTRTIAAETSQLDSPASPFLNKVSYVSGFLFNHSERFIRQVSALSTYILEMEKQTGKKVENLTDADIKKYGDAAAKKATDVTLWVNSSPLLTTAPRFGQTFLGGAGSLMMQFKQVPAQFLYTHLRMVDAVFKTMTGKAMSKEEAEEARVLRNTFMYLTGTGATLVGVKGIPFYGLFVMIANMFLGDDEDDANTIVAKQIGLGWYYGAIFKYLGIDLTDRIALTNLMIRDRGNYVPDNEYEYWMEAIGGPALSIGKRTFESVSELMDGDPNNNERAFRQAMPTPINNIMRGYEFYTKGYETSRGDVIVGEIGLGDALAQAFGFAPAINRVKRDELSRNTRVTRGIANRRSKLLDRFANITKKERKESASDVINDITQFNIDHPDNVISPDDLMQSLRSRSARTLNATVTGGLPTTKQYIREVLESNREFED